MVLTPRVLRRLDVPYSWPGGRKDWTELARGLLGSRLVLDLLGLHLLMLFVQFDIGNLELLELVASRTAAIVFFISNSPCAIGNDGVACSSLVVYRGDSIYAGDVTRRPTARRRVPRRYPPQDADVPWFQGNNLGQHDDGGSTKPRIRSIKRAVVCADRN